MNTLFETLSKNNSIRVLDLSDNHFGSKIT